MNTLPRVGERTMVFARVLLALADESYQITVSDEELIAKGVAGSVEPGCCWKNPDQAMRDSLQLLERLGAIDFERRKRGRRCSTSTTLRTITLNREHFLWSVLNLVEVSR